MEFITHKLLSIESCIGAMISVCSRYHQGMKKGTSKRKSAARIEKERKRKASAKNRKLIKHIAMIVLAVALIALIVFSLVAPPKAIG